MAGFSASVGILNNIILQQKNNWSDMNFLLDTTNTDQV